MNEVSYDAGDEVLLGGDAKAIASIANGALRGVVVTSHPGASETGYTVRFPGRLGTVRLPVGVLLPATPFEPIQLGARFTASTLDEAVSVLAEVAARLVRCQARGKTPDRLDILDCRTIAAAIEQRCHMLPGQILDQLTPEAAGLLGTGHVPHPAGLARRDIVVRDLAPAYKGAERRASAGAPAVRRQSAGAR